MADNDAYGADVEEPFSGICLFNEPAGFYQPEKQPTFQTHKLLSGETLRPRLVGHNPLWGHYLWNAGRVTSHYLEENAAELVKGKNVLELGAGAGLPSLVCAIKGAERTDGDSTSQVIVTDYPDPDLVSNLQWNINHCDLLDHRKLNIFAKGYIWGRPLEDIVSCISEDSFGERRFGLVILSDLLFNHSEHPGLLTTIKLILSKESGSTALVFFTPHRPWLYQKDVAFFDLATSEGLVVKKILEKKMDAPMFEEDKGDLEMRRTVYGYTIKWPDI
ncbi:nicotinamide N-methyltransferas-like protein Nnt1 [Kalaharituber pfeilii]|nr:nicotinamide N-methyltransferas-like protein Nnt1 [Kalaharituber pfeilii]